MAGLNGTFVEYSLHQIQGLCNFRDISHGQWACGCRRFWPRAAHGQRYDDNSAERARYWCECGHHACFHDYHASRPSEILGDVPLIGTNQAYQPRPNQQSKADSTHADVQVGVSVPRDPFLEHDRGSKAVWNHSIAENAFKSYAREQAGSTTDEGSTVAFVHPPTVIPSDPPDLYRSQPQIPTMQKLPSPYGKIHVSDREPRKASRIGPIPMNVGVTDSTCVDKPVDDVHHILQGCLRRIEVLESLSSSHVPIEEIEDKFENLDARLLDLETWRVDSEAQQTQKSVHKPSSQRQRRSQRRSASSSSSPSASLSDSESAGPSSSTLSATAAVYAAYAARFDSLEDRIGGLETSLPSFSHPWLVEVVLLPYGKHLRGIWMTSEDEAVRTQTSIHDNNEWDGFQSSKTSFAARDRSHDIIWKSESILAWANTTAEWLCPKACGPNGVVFRRLANLGLVQLLSITSPDAHGIIETCREAFSEFLTRSNKEMQVPQEILQRYQSLNEPFAPLRKVKKSSRLRFLSRNEMVTSASWSAALLESSIIMKARPGIRRLYITTPDAYVQRDTVGWSWQSLRHLATRSRGLSRDDEDQDIIPDSSEPCWAYYPTLDDALRSDESSESDSNEVHLEDINSQRPFTDDNSGKDDDWTRMTNLRDDIAPTSSLPTPFSENLSTKRRQFGSFDTSTAVQKRRRISRSSRGSRITPRPSREPASPYLSDDQRYNHDLDQDTDDIHGATSNAYATPHSNATNGGVAYTMGHDGDTEVETDNISDGSPQRQAQGPVTTMTIG